MKTWTAFPLVILVALSGLALAQDLGSPTGSTPYDAYLGPMRSTLNSLGSNHTIALGVAKHAERMRSTLNSLGSNHPPLNLVSEYVRTGRGFRYFMKHPHIPQTPAETEASRAGDCKAKSLWVAYKMDDRRLRFVVGKARAVSGMNHAWLLWNGPNGWWILDPTNYSRPIDLGRTGPNEFIPLYSYTAGGKFVHAGAEAPKRPSAKYGDHM